MMKPNPTDDVTDDLQDGGSAAGGQEPGAANLDALLDSIRESLPQDRRPALQALPKILIADDEHPVRHSLQRYFEARGFAVTSASDGEEALFAIREGGFSAMIIDVHMPRRSGLEVLQSIRRVDQETPVLMLTPLREHLIAHHAMQLGASDCMTKPIYPEKLERRSIVRNLLEARPAT